MDEAGRQAALHEVQGTLLTWRARVDNLANRKYWASAGGYPDQGYLVIGAPRQAWRSATARHWHVRVVDPTWQTSRSPSRHIW